MTCHDPLRQGGERSGVADHEIVVPVGGGPTLSRVRYFGEPYDAPVYEDAERAPVPVGRICAECEEPITETDRGFLIPHLPSLDIGGGVAAIGELPWHRRCFLRNIGGPGVEGLLDGPQPST